MCFVEFVIFILLYTVYAADEVDNKPPVIYGMKSLICEGSFSKSVPEFPSNHLAEFYVFGNNLSPSVHVGISREANCEYVEASKLILEDGSEGHVAFLSVITPPEGTFMEKVAYYFCAKLSSDSQWETQGTKGKVAFYVYRPLLPPIMIIFIIIMCFTMSSLMSGLNIGLMSLDLNELRLLKNAGTNQEKKYANTIIPVRRNGNYLLCSILITATLCNSVATVSIDNFVSDYVTVIVVTIVIVLVCEILPQSICTYFPLIVGANTIYVTKACMILTAPVSYPLSLLLNFLLGKELTATYTKERLKELLKLTQLPTTEEKIITGTLELSQKKVEDVMTLLEDIFILPITAVMDFDTIAMIQASGYSRIPIYEGETSNIVNVLLTKDLALLDPDDKVPVKILVKFSKFDCKYIPTGTTLDVALGIFVFKNNRGHMAFVIDNELPPDDKDKHVIGLITFEDVIEEIFQTEINDETDTFTDNRSKRRLTGWVDNSNLLMLIAKSSKRTTATPSENLKLATFHFLSGIDIFSGEYISPKVLLCLLNLDVFYWAPGRKLPQDNLYIRGVPADFFVMVLEGQMEVTIGSEDFKFEAGAFKFFGVEALKRASVLKADQNFKPDYTVQAVKKSMYLKIPRVMYEAAVLATRLEKYKEVPDISTTSELYQYYKLLIDTDADTKASKKN